MLVMRQMFPTRYFEKQFELAEAVKLPMFLHMRAAAEDFCDILAQNKERLLKLQIDYLKFVYFIFIFTFYFSTHSRSNFK